MWGTMNDTTTTPHFMLTLTPGELILSHLALQTLARKAKEMGHPISKKEAREWLARAADDGENWGRDNREDWTEWALDYIDELS